MHKLSGDVAPFAGSRHLVVAVLITKDPRPIELHVKRARKSLGRRANLDELKAADVQSGVIGRLLQAIVEEDVEIVAVIVDKRSILKPPGDAEDIYREAVKRAVRHCVERHSRLELWLDKRYTKPSLRNRLEKALREGIADLAEQMVLVHQEDSRNQKGLQAVDHVAWALYQKYERGDEHLYQILEGRVVVEEVVSRQLW
ncbi:MAG: DUF3800 domain-containing protein [Chloroflexi bacterium]|nr:DUF3800 domain-containing protein [Chloroflexota bacterium]